MSIALNGDGIISGVSTLTTTPLDVVTLDATEINVGTGASVFSPAANTLALGTNGSERVRVTSGGNVEIANGNLVFSTAGTGIDFSATADGSGTTTSELLDDYEEGTWTPTIPGTSITYSLQQGVYTKIGNVVYIRGIVILSGGTPTGGVAAAIVGGLPFTCEATQYWTLTTSTNGGNFGGTVPIAQVVPSTSAISAIGITNNSGFVDSTATSVWDANGNWVQVAGFYRV